MARYTEIEGSSYITAEILAEAIDISKMCSGCAFRNICDGMSVDLRQAKMDTHKASEEDINFFKNDAPCL